MAKWIGWTALAVVLIVYGSMFADKLIPVALSHYTFYMHNRFTGKILYCESDPNRGRAECYTMKKIIKLPKKRGGV